MFPNAAGAGVGIEEEHGVVEDVEGVGADLDPHAAILEKLEVLGSGDVESGGGRRAGVAEGARGVADGGRGLGAGHEITDQQTGQLWRLQQLQPNGKTPEEYVIVSRLFHPKTGKLLFALAGITQYGTQAAGEFVTDAGLLEDA